MISAVATNIVKIILENILDTIDTSVNKIAILMKPPVQMAPQILKKDDFLVHPL